MTMIVRTLLLLLLALWGTVFTLQAAQAFSNPIGRWKVENGGGLYKDQPLR